MSRDLPSTPTDFPQSTGSGRKPYRKPEIVAYGRVEDMTRSGGNTPGEPKSKPKAG